MNAVFVGAAVLLIVIAVFPQGPHIQNSLAVLASVAGQPPVFDEMQYSRGISSGNRVVIPDRKRELEDHVANARLIPRELSPTFTFVSATVAPEEENRDSDDRITSKPTNPPKVVADHDRHAHSTADPAWPAPVELKRQIEPLKENIKTASWSIRTLELLDHLSQVDSITDPLLIEIFAQLEKQRQQLPRLMVMVSTVPTDHPGMAQGAIATRLGQIEYGIAKRLCIWTLVYRIARQENNSLAEENSRQVTQMIQASGTRFSFNVHPQWREYLLTEEAESVFNSLNSSDFKKRKIARKVLSRANSPALTLKQHQFAVGAIDPQLVGLLKRTASNTPDLHQLLIFMEKHESEGSGLTQYKVNDQYQNMLWSDNQICNQLAQQLDVHYRNANFRVSVSEQLVNRLIPQMPATAEPFSERILGAHVYGQNHIQNWLAVELIPDPDQIQMQIVTRGEVRSNSRASKSGFTVDNRGITRFQVFKRLAFGKHGVYSDQPVATSAVSQQLVGLSSKYDSIPLVGRMARRIAKKKMKSDAPRTEQIVRQRVESTASQRMQSEVESKINEVKAYLNKRLYLRLVAMELEPDPLELSTSNDRIVMRYRLSGRDQLAANTARPRAIQGSLLSMQIHQSAINNMLMRIGLNGRKFKAQELINHLQMNLGIIIKGADEIEQEAEFEFAHFDPIRVDFADGKIKFSVNLKSFKIGKRGKRWRNLSVKSTYVPHVQGNRIVLKQEKPGLCLKGKNLKLRDQLAVRAIFEALLTESYSAAPIPAKLVAKLNSPNLQIGQLVSEDGWIGISVTEPGTQQHPQLSRIPGRILRRRR